MRKGNVRIEEYYQDYLRLLSLGLSHSEALKDFESWLNPISLARLALLVKSRGPVKGAVS